MQTYACGNVHVDEFMQFGIRTRHRRIMHMHTYLKIKKARGPHTILLCVALWTIIVCNRYYTSPEFLHKKKTGKKASTPAEGRHKRHHASKVLENCSRKRGAEVRLRKCVWRIPPSKGNQSVSVLKYPGLVPRLAASNRQ